MAKGPLVIQAGAIERDGPPSREREIAVVFHAVPGREIDVENHGSEVG
jgi:hypothetical protein